MSVTSSDRKPPACYSVELNLLHWKEARLELPLRDGG